MRRSCEKGDEVGKRVCEKVKCQTVRMWRQQSESASHAQRTRTFSASALADLRRMPSAAPKLSRGRIIPFFLPFFLTPLTQSQSLKKQKQKKPQETPMFTFLVKNSKTHTANTHRQCQVYLNHAKTVKVIMMMVASKKTKEEEDDE